MCIRDSICNCALSRVAVRVSDLVFLRVVASALQESVPFWISRSVCGRPFVCSSLRPVHAISCLPTSVQLLHVTVLFGNSSCTIRRLMRSSQLSSTCSVMPLATRNFALIVTLLAMAVSHVQPSTVIFCPLQVDSVELVGLIIRFLSRASFADIKLAVYPLRAQRLINLEIPVLVRSLKSSNVELG